MCLKLDKKQTIVLNSVLLGISITLVTGFVLNAPVGLVGVARYGYILPWISRPVVHPMYATTNILWTNLIIDIVFWSVVAFLFFKLVWKDMWKPKRRPAKRPVRKTKRRRR